jgi:arylsulfatase A-like enzyme
VRRLAAVALAMSLTLAGGLLGSPAPRAQPGTGRPNILVIMTDDQRPYTLSAMRKTRTRFRDQGTTFSNAYAATPLCCPSRASVMTGRYAHNHGVTTNIGAASKLDQRSTIQRYLRDNGYFTATAGKFFNDWPVTTNPSYFDRWTIFGGGYANTNMNVDGVVGRVAEYSTTFIRTKAIEYIRTFEQADDARPWYISITPFAPHSPYTAEPKYQEAPVGTWNGNPAVFETDKRDKPPYVRTRNAGLLAGQEVRTKQLRTQRSVDDLVGAVFGAMDTLGETGTTLAIFLSDNGFMWAEHGIIEKRMPYTQAIRIPLYVRWPGHARAGATDHRLVANIDLAPTILGAAGITPDAEYRMDGKSLFSSARHPRLLLEYFFDTTSAGTAHAPPWAGNRTTTYEYVEWYDTASGALTFREYYDLVDDPWQLVNLLADGDPSNDPNVTTLSAQLALDRRCQGVACP